MRHISQFSDTVWKEVAIEISIHSICFTFSRSQIFKHWKEGCCYKCVRVHWICQSHLKQSCINSLKMSENRTRKIIIPKFQFWPIIEEKRLLKCRFCSSLVFNFFCAKIVNLAAPLHSKEAPREAFECFSLAKLHLSSASNELKNLILLSSLREWEIQNSRVQQRSFKISSPPKYILVPLWSAKKIHFCWVVATAGNPSVFFVHGV